MSTPPLVLLHGWGLTPRVWAPLRAALPPDLTVHAPALPGHGDATPAAAPGLDAWSDALLPAIPDASVLCGWSLGALVALYIARRYPHKVARLVLIGATPCFVAHAGEDAWPHGLAAGTVSAFTSGFVQQPAATLQRFIALQALGDARRRAVQSGLAQALAPTDGARLTALADGLRILAESDLRKVVHQLAPPTQLIHGANDALMPVAAAHWLAAQLPQATLSALDGCGHAAMLSRPAECAALIEAGLRD